MIQPKWDQLSESTQRAVNAPSQSQQLQEAYNAGYYRALNEDLGDAAKRKMTQAAHQAARNTPTARAARDAGRAAKEAAQIATHNAARARRASKWWRAFNVAKQAGKIGRLFTPAGLAMGGAELGVAYGPNMSADKEANVAAGMNPTGRMGYSH